MKKTFAALLTLVLLLTGLPAISEGVPPEPPQGFDGEMPSGMQPPEGFGGGKPNDDMQPPEGFDGGKPSGMQSPEGFDGGMPNGDMQPPEGFNGEKPSDMQPPEGFGGQMPGGMDGAPESYAAVRELSADTEIAGENVASVGTDENAILVTSGNVRVTDCDISRVNENSTGGDSASFYGVGAAVLVTGGSAMLDGCNVETDAAGGAGVFAYASGTAEVSDCTIVTEGDTSGGIHVAGGGTLTANNLTVETSGASSAAIRSDRGGGTMTVNGGSYTSHGYGSPAVYVTADIAVSGANLAATGAEALCLEGKNSVTLTDCALSGNMPDQQQNDCTWTVILYQSMSGDAEAGEGAFTMIGGRLQSENGGVFYTTNTDSVFTLRNVAITACADSEFLLRCTGNNNARGWGQSGSNGANCVFCAACQELNGNVIYDSISNLTLELAEGSTLCGAILDDESCAGAGGNGTCNVTIDETSAWIVTEDSTVTTLACAGQLLDAQGLTVTVVQTDGSVLVRGEGERTVTVSAYIGA